MDQHEFEAAIKHLCPGISQKDTVAVFNSHTSSGEGVDYKAFADELFEQAERWSQECFDGLDNDQNGEIDPAELLGIFSELGFHQHDEQAAQKVARVNQGAGGGRGLSH